MHAATAVHRAGERRSVRTSSRRASAASRDLVRAGRPSLRAAALARARRARRACLGAVALASGLRPSAASEHARRAAGRHLPGDGALPRALRRPRDRLLVRGPLEQLVLTENLGRLLGLEGCLSGNAPADAEPTGGRAGPCAELARDEARAGGLRPGHVHQLGRGRDPGPAAGAGWTRRRADAEKAAAAARGLARAAGQAAGRAGPAGGGAAEQLVYARAGARPAPAQPQVRARHGRDAAARRPGLRVQAGVRPGAGGDDAEGALSLPVPVLGVGRDPGAAEARPARRGARAGHRARARGGARCREVRAARRRRLHGDRRARPRRGPRGRARGLGRAAGSSSRSW